MRTGSRLRRLLAAVAVIALGAVPAYFVLRAPVSPDPAAPGSATLVPLQDLKQADAPGAPAARQAPDGAAAWTVVDPESVEELPPYKEVVPGRALVRVSGALRRGTAGGRIALEVPQLGRTFEGLVERTDTDSFGNVTYIGLIREADGREYRFIITAGGRNTFAHLGTSRGAFELVAAKDDLGWLMPSANMDQHVDYSKPDYIIREEPPPHED